MDRHSWRSPIADRGNFLPLAIERERLRSLPIQAGTDSVNQSQLDVIGELPDIHGKCELVDVPWN